jgi:hypothetical protein
MQRTTGPDQPPPIRQTFWPDAHAPAPRQPAGAVRRELFGGPAPEARIDARTAELRERIAKAARIPLIGGLLLLIR